MVKRILRIFPPSAINLLALTITSVAPGNWTPIAPYIFSKIGTTFHNIKIVIVVATVKSITG